MTLVFCAVPPRNLFEFRKTHSMENNRYIYEKNEDGQTTYRVRVQRNNVDYDKRFTVLAKAITYRDSILQQHNETATATHKKPRFNITNEERHKRYIVRYGINGKEVRERFPYVSCTPEEARKAAEARQKELREAEWNDSPPPRVHVMKTTVVKESPTVPIAVEHCAPLLDADVSDSDSD